MQAWEKSKARRKFLPLKNKSNKNFNGTCLGLAFLQRVGQCGACIPLLAFFAVLVPDQVGGQCGYLATARKYIMPVIGQAIDGYRCLGTMQLAGV